MKDFFAAAFPWVAVGIAIIVLFVCRRDKTKGEKSETPEYADKKAKEDHLSECMCIGMALGLLLGTTGVFSIGVGLSVGLLLGVAVGTSWNKKH